MSKLKPLGSRLALILLLVAALLQAALAAEKKNVIEDAIFSETTAITRFSPGGQYVMLTFDGGPRSVLTNKILDILHDNYATATFFVQGSKAFEHPQVVKRMALEGHEVASRGLTGKTFPLAPNNAIMTQIREASDILHNITGFWPALIRPPYGITSNKTSKMIESNTNMKTILWNFDPSRISGKKPKQIKDDNSDLGSLIPSLIVKNIVDNVKIGDVIYFREGNADIVIALPAIINSLHKQGFELLTISEMMKYPDDKPH